MLSEETLYTIWDSRHLLEKQMNVAGIRTITTVTDYRYLENVFYNSRRKQQNANGIRGVCVHKELITL